MCTIVIPGSKNVSLHQMKKYLLTIMLFLVGCNPVHGTDSSHTGPTEMIVTASSKIIQASITPTNPTPTITQTATTTPEPSPTIQWTTPDNQVNILDNSPGIWSPTSNKLLFLKCTGEKAHLLVASAPDFNPEVISENVVSCPGLASITWGMDGKHIYYGGPLPEGDVASEQPIMTDVWVVEPDGTNERRLNQKSLRHRWLEFRGWMDNRTLVTFEYWGGGHQFIRLIDTITGQSFAGAFFYGTTFDEPNTSYFPAVTMLDEYTATLFVIGKSPQPRPFESIRSDFARAFPASEESEGKITTSFLDWMPGTNKMLVHVIGKDVNDIFKEQISIWDLDQDSANLLIPDGISGKFSPDGKILAFARENENDQAQNVSSLQILNMSTGEISLSLPVLVDLDEFEPFITHPRINFSQNGRFLAFISPTNLLEENRFQSDYYINVLDLSGNKIIWSGESNGSIPAWSHQSNSFVYKDAKQNLIYWQSNNISQTGIYKGSEEKWSYASWSYDDNYLSVYSDDQTTIIQMR